MQRLTNSNNCPNVNNIENDMYIFCVEFITDLCKMTGSNKTTRKMIMFLK